MTTVLYNEINLGLSIALSPHPKTLFFSGVGGSSDHFLSDNMLGKQAFIESMQVIMIKGYNRFCNKSRVIFR